MAITIDMLSDIIAKFADHHAAAKLWSRETRTRFAPSLGPLPCKVCRGPCFGGVRVEVRDPGGEWELRRETPMHLRCHNSPGRSRARGAPNRHDRRRSGAARPGAPSWVLSDILEDMQVAEQEGNHELADRLLAQRRRLLRGRDN